MNGLQAWITLPQEHEETEPSFAHYGGDRLPVIDDGGARLRIIAGEAYGAKAGVAVFSPLFYVHCRLDAGASIASPHNYSERAAYVVTGSVEIGADRVGAGEMAVFASHKDVRLKAHVPTHMMLLGGSRSGRASSNGTSFHRRTSASSRRKRIGVPGE